MIHGLIRRVCFPRWPWCDRVDFRSYMTDWKDRCVVAFAHYLSSKVHSGFPRGVAEPAGLLVVARGKVVVSGNMDGESTPTGVCAAHVSSWTRHGL